MKKKMTIALMLIGVTLSANAKSNYETYRCNNNNCKKDQYLGKVRKEIQKHIEKENTKRYKGRICEFKINLEMDGKINGIRNIKGDYELCNMVVKATKNIKVDAPTKEQYEEFKSLNIYYRP